MNNLTCTEISELFELLGEETKKKIPNKFWVFIEKNKLKHYDKQKIRQDLWKGIISEEALNLYAALKYKYLCEDKLEKKILAEIYSYNINKGNTQKPTKLENGEMCFSEDLFQKYKDTDNRKISTELVILEKEKFLNKVLRKIKQFLKGK